MPVTDDHFIDRFLKKIWERDVSLLDPSRRVLVKSIRLFHVAIKEFNEGELTLRAMSLVYTTMLALVPLLAVSFSVLKAFGVHNQAEPIIRNFLHALGPKGDELTVKIVSFVDNVRAGILGTVGLALLIYTVVSLLKKVEESLNHIWKIRRPRTFLQRLNDYTSTILLGPILIFTAIGITATVLNTSIVKGLQSIEPFGTLFLIAGKLVPFVLACLAFSMVYIIIPNTKVKISSALVGGLIAGTLWQLSGWAFASFVAASTKYTAIYSGFAITLIFMIWLYLSWLILLTGGVISFHYQYPQPLTVRKEPFHLSNRLKERLSFIIVILVGYRFHMRQPNWTLDTLLRRLDLPFEPVQDVLDLLEKKKIIRSTSDNPPEIMVATDLSEMTVKEFWHTIRGAEEDVFSIEEQFLSMPPVDAILKELTDSVDTGLGERTIMDLVMAHGEDPGKV